MLHSKPKAPYEREFADGQEEEVVLMQPTAATKEAEVPGATCEVHKVVTPSQSFIVQQILETVEVLTGSETSNRYEIQDQKGHKIMEAVETTNWCKRHCCRCCGSFKIKFVQGLENLAYLDAGVDCCGQTVTVSDDQQNVLGTVRKGLWVCPCIYPNFYIEDSAGSTLFKVRTPLCVHWSTCCKDVTFHISAASGAEVGYIKRKAEDFAGNTLTDRDTFHLILHNDLPAPHKVLLLAAVFPIDFSYYEK